MAQFAIIETGGKQYKVSSGVKVKIEKVKGEAGDKVAFDKVLLVAKGADVQIGTPHISGAAVEGKIIRQSRAKKVIVFKYHSKTRYRRKQGHRQHFTEVEIVKL